MRGPVLAKGKLNYRYYNNGEFIEKKDKSMERDTNEQLNLTKKQLKVGVYGVINPENPPSKLKRFEDIESLTTFQDAAMPFSDQQTLMKTKSLSSLFRKESLSSLQNTMKPPVIPTLD